MPTLVLHSPEHNKRWAVEVDAERFFLGRAREAQVCIPHESVSKRHLTVERRGGRYYFRDEGSRNGVKLNGFRMKQGPLEEGDELQLGQIVITFHREKPPAPVGGEPPAPGSLSVTPAPQAAGEEVEGDPLPRFDPGSTLALPDDSTSPLDLAEAFDPELEVTGRERRAPGRPRDRRSAPAPMRSLPAGPRRLDGGKVCLGVAACILLGVLLGYASRWLERQQDAPSGAPGAPTAPTPPGPAPAAPVAATQASAVPTQDPAGPRAQLADQETLQRFIVRCFLDLAGRPPLASELEQLARESPEKAWLAAEAQSPPSAAAPGSSLEASFARLVGRAPTREEHEALLAASGGDPMSYLHAVALRAEYSSPEHRRKRSREQLASSLSVDLAGDVPRGAQLERLVAGLEGQGQALEDLTRSLLEEGARRGVGPPAGQDPEGWIRATYARMLLRAPHAAEIGKARSHLRVESGWKALLRDLARSKEYLEY